MTSESVVVAPGGSRWEETVNSTVGEEVYESFVASVKSTVSPVVFAGNEDISHVIVLLTVSITGDVEP